MVMSLRTLLVLIFVLSDVGALLQPQASEFREKFDIGGIWNFRSTLAENPDLGFQEKWFEKPLSETGNVIPMPVPSSYNDITQDRRLRDYAGWVWYDTQFFVPRRWQADNQRVFIRFGSVHYEARVYVNGKFLTGHIGGHLPFEAELDDFVRWNISNRLTVAVSSNLTKDTIPQAAHTYHSDSKNYPPGYMTVQYEFDFFNYGGIHRAVTLYTTPSVYIRDISISTQTLPNYGIGKLYYNIVIENTIRGNSANYQDPQIVVQVVDRTLGVVGESSGLQGNISVQNATLWWPIGMNKIAGYMYTLLVSLRSGDTIDIYRQKFGFREVNWDNEQVLINGKPFYFKGFGKHEDSDIRGKGLDLPLIIKDFNLIRWLGANSFRTSHYPYAEEVMDQADEQGIVVIDETPAVGIDKFDAAMLSRHKQIVQDLIARDRNHPSVIMWSLGNECKTNKPGAENYFSELYTFAHKLDSTRPVTLVFSADYLSDRVGQHMDVILVNRYFAWYNNPGRTELIKMQVITEFENWRQTHNKPIMISEYGADTIPGLHADPPFIFSEDYQVEFMGEYFKAFDELRTRYRWFIGEMVWNFADFMTDQSITRVMGNKKGIFTRQRQPKESAKLLRNRYTSLG